MTRNTQPLRVLGGALLLFGLTACNAITGGPSSPKVVTMTFGGADVEVLHGRLQLRVDVIDEDHTAAQEIAVNVKCEGVDEAFIVGPTIPEDDALHCDTLFQVVEINSDNGSPRSVRLRMSWDDE